MQKITFEDFKHRFPDDDACLDWLRHKLYPENIFCPVCTKPTKHHRIKSRKVYSCQECGNHISPTAGTIFHKSRTSLRVWFYVIFQMSRTGGGISAKQIERDTGVTYKTAWRMRKLVHDKLAGGDSPFSGEVMIDESYLDGTGASASAGST